ncbi:MAG: YhbY family RNA-binding protein [Thiotrichaceae bacterium]
MELTNPQKKKLKGFAHDLHPLVTIGQKGLKESIHDEIETALDFHQLVKVKVMADDRDQRKDMIALIADKHKAMVIQTVGHIVVLYKRNNDKTNLLSKKS